MKNKRIAVVMGGPSAEREVSLNTGQAVLSALLAKGYDAVGIDLNPAQFVDQLKAARVDIVFNAMHGRFGEDGALQGTLDLLGIPYTGSGVLASAIAMDKTISKRLFLSAGIPTPQALCFEKNREITALTAEIRREFSLPVVVKAASQGSSIGVFIVMEDEQLEEAVREAFRFSDRIVVEEFIKGKELTVAVINGDDTEALPVIEIVPHSGRYDYRSKYTKGCTDYIVPAPLTSALTANVQQIALTAVTLLGCRGVSRVDMMMDDNGNAFVLEVNTIPGMTATSLVPKAAAAIGLDFPALCERLLLMAAV